MVLGEAYDRNAHIAHTVSVHMGALTLDILVGRFFPDIGSDPVSGGSLVTRLIPPFLPRTFCSPTTDATLNWCIHSYSKDIAAVHCREL